MKYNHSRPGFVKFLIHWGGCWHSAVDSSHNKIGMSQLDIFDCIGYKTAFNEHFYQSEKYFHAKKSIGSNYFKFSIAGYFASKNMWTQDRTKSVK